MSIADSLLPEYDQEMGTTRRVLERVDESQVAWKPHEKSMTLGRLASHVAELPGWGATAFEQDSFDIAPATGRNYNPADLATRQEILDLFDANVKRSRAIIAKADDATMLQPWSLLRTGKTIFTLPRVGTLRAMCINHIIHHRGQLSVYLRLTGSLVPSIYGPSADEPIV